MRSYAAAVSWKAASGGCSDLSFAMCCRFTPRRSGMAYGLVNPLVGHPFNLVQTRMQADAKFQSECECACAPVAL